MINIKTSFKKCTPVAKCPFHLKARINQGNSVKQTAVAVTDEQYFITVINLLNSPELSLSLNKYQIFVGTFLSLSY